MTGIGWAGAAAREVGSAALELVLGFAVLVLPVALIVLTVPGWVERQSAAGLAAQQAARAFVTAPHAAQAPAEARFAAEQVLANHAVIPASAEIRVEGALDRGSLVTATVRVQVPAVVLPGVGTAGGFWITATHVERVDDYRSLP